MYMVYIYITNVHPHAHTLKDKYVHQSYFFPEAVSQLIDTRR